MRPVDSADVRVRAAAVGFRVVDGGRMVIDVRVDGQARLIFDGTRGEVLAGANDLRTALTALLGALEAPL